MIQPAALLDTLAPLIGREGNLHSVNYDLKRAVRQLNPPVVGALHVTCSDESEHESVESFQSTFAQDLLPRLKYAHRAPMRTSTLGGRYEWQSLPLAEQHFATPQSAATFKLLAVKINAHVASVSHLGENAYGVMPRYDTASPCCGALAAMLEGAHIPAVSELRELFTSEGVDRVAMLEEVEPRLRPLVAAITSARLQARSAVLDAQDYVPQTPTVYLVLPVVTLNKRDRDSELLCGAYVIDRRRERQGDVYRGLGDQPSQYEILEPHGHVEVRDGHVAAARPARDHRRLIDEARRGNGTAVLPRSPKVDALLGRARQQSQLDRQLRSTLLKGLLVALAELSPVSAALLLFAQGGSAIYNAYRAHRLVRDVDASPEARQMLTELHDRVDRLPAAEAERVLRVLLSAYEPAGKTAGESDSPDERA